MYTDVRELLYIGEHTYVNGLSVNIKSDDLQCLVSNSQFVRSTLYIVCISSTCAMFTWKNVSCGKRRPRRVALRAGFIYNTYLLYWKYLFISSFLLSQVVSTFFTSTYLYIFRANNII